MFKQAKSNGLVTQEQAGFTSDQVELIKKTIAVGATDDELKLFLYTCEKRRLDPLVRQIYFQKRGTKDNVKMTIITGIDGYRLIADRTGRYAGNDDPVFDNEEDVGKATVTVYKIVQGVRCAFTATARWHQYYPGDAQGFMWKKMPHLMLAKCAEALALRKAFPEELSGLYIEEEMHQAGPPITYTEPQKPQKAPVVEVLTTYDAETPELKAQLFTLAKGLGVTKVEDLKTLNLSCKGKPMAGLEAAAKEWVQKNLRPKL